jgi:hypothetical protein
MYEIEPRSLVFSGGKRCCFAGDIAGIISFDETIVVRLVDDPISVLNNVFGVDYRGNLVWQIPHPVSFTLQRPYVTVTKNCGHVNALSWDGHIVTVHPKSGIILNEDYSSYGVIPSSRRVPPPRRWL